ncbi:hypothetical protein [Flavobacterium sp. GCM10023249]|uniref:hypothetical protein n=1 Tax=unclassified Flavobacterium TaxID=196869 RepID=UPI00360D4ACE
MNENNLNIAFENNIKLYVLQKDTILFESELKKQGIEYYCDIDNQVMVDNGIRYIFKATDSIKLDKILMENAIIASTETISIYDYRDAKKAQKLYFKVTGIVLAVMVLLLIIEHFFN